jgi:hypothetical protein
VNTAGFFYVASDGMVKKQAVKLDAYQFWYDQ